MEAVGTGVEDARLWNRIRLLLVGLVVCRGLVWLCVLPPFEGWDEYQHVGYVQHVAETGEAAILGETNAPRSLLVAQAEFPQSPIGRESLRPFGLRNFSNYWTTPRDASIAEAVGPDVVIPLYQAQHGSLYYRIAAPFYTLAGGVDHLRVSVGVLRLLNLAFIVAAVWLALGVVGRLVVDARLASLFGLLIATQPLFLINGVRVANDALGVLLATIVVALGLTWRDAEDRVLLRSGLLGVCLGLAILAKAVNLGLAPFVAFCWLVVVVQRRVGWPRAVGSAAVVALGSLAVSGPELYANLMRYGALTPMVEAVLNRKNGMTSVDLLHAAQGIDWWTKLSGVWLNDNLCKAGWSFFDAGPRLIVRHHKLVVACLLGWLFLASPWPRRKSPVFRSATAPTACLTLCLSYTAALSYHMVHTKLAQGVSMTNTWYAAATLPWFLVLVAGGALSWPARRLRPVLPALLATTFLTAEATTIWARLVPTCSGGLFGWDSLTRLASLQPALFGTPTLLAALLGQLVALALAVVLWARLESQRSPIATKPDLTNATLHPAHPNHPHPLAARLPWRAGARRPGNPPNPGAARPRRFPPEFPNS